MRFNNKMRAMTFCFVIVLILLIGQVFLNVKDVNDGWILEGVFPLFLLFVTLFTVIVSFSSNLKFVVIVTSIFQATLVLIPNLKYIFVYGYHDPLGHYGYIRNLINSGHVPESGFYASEYQYTPGSHIFVSAISLTTGLDAVAAMKVFLIASAFIIPFATYLVMKKLETPKKLFKIIIITTAITSPVQYIYSGTIAIYPILVLFFYFWLLLACNNSTRSNVLIATLLGIVVIISHDVTSFFVLVCLAFVLFVILFAKAVKHSKYIEKNTLFSVTIMSLILAHFVFVSNFNFSRIISLIQDSIESLFTSSPVAFEYYQSFFELSLIQKLNVLAVRFAKYVIIIFLLILTPLAIWRLKLGNDSLNRFYRNLVVPSFVAFLFFILVLFIRPLEFRGIIYLSAFSPFLAGTTLFWLIYSKQQRFENTILAIIVFSLISASIVQIYPCQPLIPKVSTEYGDYYVADWRQVSTAYTRSMVYFVATHNTRLNVWADDITRWEIYGLTSPIFQSLLSWRSFSSPLLLLSHAGNAHIIASAKGAIANEQYLQNVLQVNNILYNNGKSYIFFNATIDYAR